MKTYANVRGNVVAEIITAAFYTDDSPEGLEPAWKAGDEIPIDERFHSDFLAHLVPVPDGVAEVGWAYDGTKFSAPVAPAPDLEEVKAAKVALVQTFMDRQAQSRGYDNITTAITYADEPAVATFQAEGQAFRTWRSLVWGLCFSILEEVNKGNRPIPTDEELIGALPPLDLPPREPLQ